MKKSILLLPLLILFHGCAHRQVEPPQWNPVMDATETEYNYYLTQPGNGAITGQAFLNQQGGGVVKAAGRTVTLDPATAVGTEWWGKAGKVWLHRELTPPSPAFHKARRTTVADADGRFKFLNLPPGYYYVRTEVTWQIGGYYSTQGGLVGQMVELKKGVNQEIILNQLPQ